MAMADDRTLQLASHPAGIATHGARGFSRGLALRFADKEVALLARPVRIGAGADVDVLLTDKAVSRVHAEVLPAKGGALVRDLGSRNGTWVGDARVQEAVVPVGGELRVGETRLRVIDRGAPLLEPSRRDRFGALLGESRAMREVFAVLELAAPTDATVLVEGPSGTGKELTARALHDHSPRAAGPFRAFDCGTTQRELLSSALLGHKKGAFTGATADRPGAFVEATGGTLFLDEIGELPVEHQTQLLRALESRQVTPVGGDRARAIDCRVVAATNRDLAAMVEAGTFRLDLFHRLAVVQVRVPPLRERLEDLPALVRGFYEGRGVDPGPIDGPNLDALRAHAFDGNVRELRNVLERSFVLSGPAAPFRALRLWLGGAAPTTTSAFGVDVDLTLTFKDAKERVVEEFERRWLAALLAASDGNLSAAARQADLSRKHLRALLVKHGLRGTDDGDDD